MTKEKALALTIARCASAVIDALAQLARGIPNEDAFYIADRIQGTAAEYGIDEANIQALFEEPDQPADTMEL